jgi:hypothetical protein
MNRCSIPGRSKIFFLSSTAFSPVLSPNQFISNGCRGLFPRGQSGQGVKLATNLHLVQRLRMHCAIPPPTRRYVFIACCLLNQKNRFFFLRLLFLLLTKWTWRAMSASYLCIGHKFKTVLHLYELISFS